MELLSGEMEMEVEVEMVVEKGLDDWMIEQTWNFWKYLQKYP